MYFSKKYALRIMPIRLPILEREKKLKEIRFTLLEVTFLRRADL